MWSVKTRPKPGLARSSARRSAGTGEGCGRRAKLGPRAGDLRRHGLRSGPEERGGGARGEARGDGPRARTPAEACRDVPGRGGGVKGAGRSGPAAPGRVRPGGAAPTSTLLPVAGREGAGAGRRGLGLDARHGGVVVGRVVVEQGEPADARGLGQRHGLRPGGMAPAAPAADLGRRVAGVEHQQVEPARQRHEGRVGRVAGRLVVGEIAEGAARRSRPGRRWRRRDGSATRCGAPARRPCRSCRRRGSRGRPASPRRSSGVMGKRGGVISWATASCRCSSLRGGRSTAGWWCRAGTPGRRRAGR